MRFRIRASPGQSKPSPRLGLIFNIQRFSIHDGPGIRTTVFFKGCPLRCRWCCNPESWDSYPEIMTYDIKCIKCGKCVEVCPVEAIVIDQRGRRISRARCNLCLACAEVCPAGAISVSGRYMTVEEVVEKVENVSGLRQQAKRLCASQRLCVLAKQYEGQPYSSLVAFAEIDELRSLIFVTSRNSRTYAYSIANRKVAMMVDSRTNQTSDFTDALAVTALGTVEEVTGNEREGFTSRKVRDLHVALVSFWPVKMLTT